MGENVLDLQERTEAEDASLRHERACWVAFSQVPQVGPVRLALLVEHFGTLAEAWTANENLLGQVSDRRTLQRICSFRRTNDPDELLAEISPPRVVSRSRGRLGGTAALSRSNSPYSVLPW